MQHESLLTVVPQSPIAKAESVNLAEVGSDVIEPVPEPEPDVAFFFFDTELLPLDELVVVELSLSPVTLEPEPEPVVPDDSLAELLSL